MSIKLRSLLNETRTSSTFHSRFCLSGKKKQMKASEICIILTLHCVKDRVREYQTALTLWNGMSTVFKRVVTVDSANNEHLNTTHGLRMYHSSPSFGEKMSLLAAMPSLLDCPFIFKWTGRYYSHTFLSSLRHIPENSTLVLQSRRNTRAKTRRCLAQHWMNCSLCCRS